MGQFVTVTKKSDLPSGKAISVDFNGKRVAIFNVDGNYYAIDDECTHAGGSLSEGELSNTIVTCPWHGATYDITSGAVLSEPAFEGVKSYKVTVEGDEIKLEAS